VASPGKKSLSLNSRAASDAPLPRFFPLPLSIQLQPPPTTRRHLATIKPHPWDYVAAGGDGSVGDAQVTTDVVKDRGSKWCFDCGQLGRGGRRGSGGGGVVTATAGAPPLAAKDAAAARAPGAAPAATGDDAASPAGAPAPAGRP